MPDTPFRIAPERPKDAAAIEKLHDFAFGPGRYVRTAWRMREGVPAVSALSYVAWAGDRLIGSVRYAPVMLSGRGGLMLGPLVVDPDWKGRGAGVGLMRASLDAARSRGHQWVILVGDEPYYARAGFRRVAGGVKLPGPVDPARLLSLELEPGALDGLAGTVLPLKETAACR